MFRFLAGIFAIVLVSACGGGSESGSENGNNGIVNSDDNSGDDNGGSNGSGSGVSTNTDGSIIFYEDFENEFEQHSNSGTVVSSSVTNISQLSQFDVTGVVDLVKSNDGFNISCPDNGGYCLDLDGTDGTGQTASKLTSKAITFSQGDHKLSFAISGNGRVADSDRLSVSVEPYLPAFELELQSDDAFSTKSYPFSIEIGGSANLIFTLLGEPDNFGPILDDIVIESIPSVVPLACSTPSESLQDATTENGITSAATAFAGNTIAVKLSEEYVGNPYVIIAETNAATTDRTSNYQYVSNADNDGFMLLNAPANPGVFEIRAISGNEVVTRKSITVIPPTLDAESSTAAGNTIDICWSGPTVNRNFYAIIAEADADTTDRATNYQYLQDEDGFGTVTLNSPVFPDRDYEIRIIVGNNVVATKSLDVAPPTIEAPASAAAGNTISIDWTGPSVNKGFYGIIAERDADSTSRSTNYEYLRDEDGFDTIDLNTPPYPDREYEIRIIVADEVVATRPLDILPPTISAPSSVESDSTVNIDWTGPSVNRNFFVIISEKDADSTVRATNYQYLQDEDGIGSVVLTTPIDPDPEYEIRVIYNDEVIVTKPIDII